MQLSDELNTSYILLHSNWPNLSFLWQTTWPHGPLKLLLWLQNQKKELIATLIHLCHAHALMKFDFNFIETKKVARISFTTTVHDLNEHKSEGLDSSE